MSNSTNSNKFENLFELLERTSHSFIKPNIENKALWKNFLNHFNEVNKDKFELFINSQQRQNLIIFLKSQDVWIQKQSSRIYSQVLYDTLNENKFVLWTKEEYNKALNYDKNFDLSVIHRSI